MILNKSIIRGEDLLIFDGSTLPPQSIINIDVNIYKQSSSQYLPVPRAGCFLQLLSKKTRLRKVRSNKLESCVVQAHVIEIQTRILQH